MNPRFVQQSSSEISDPANATSMGMGGMSTTLTKFKTSPVMHILAPPSIRSFRALM
jgi:hypothetical protein